MSKTLAGILIAVVGVGVIAWRFLIPQEPDQPPAPPRPAVVTRSPVPKKPVQSPVPKRVAAASAVPKRVPQAPPARALPASPIPRVKRIAPEGTFFLVQRASITTDSAVVGFAPGTKVSLVKQDGPTSTVTTGEYNFDIPSSQLTNDLDIAAGVAKSDLDAQTRIAERIVKSVQEHQKQQQDEIAALEKQPQPGARRTPNSSSPARKRSH